MVLFTVFRTKMISIFKMKIYLKKISKHQSEYKIVRNNGSIECISLDIKIYLIHDITHFVVEKNLGYSKGFWGMLSNGYSFKELFGKENPLTTELRFIEKIVGPVQSVFLGYLRKQDFSIHLSHVDFNFNQKLLENCLAEIKSIVMEWDKLEFGNTLTLEWRS